MHKNASTRLGRLARMAVTMAAAIGIAAGGVAAQAPGAQALDKRYIAAAEAQNIAANNYYGYDMRYRTDGRSFDCSSLVLTVLRKAGYNVTPVGNGTANMVTLLPKAGFTNVVTKINKNTGAGLQIGDVLLRTGTPYGHTAIVSAIIGSTIKVTEATTTGSKCSTDKKGLVYCGAFGDQSGNEIRTVPYSSVMHNYQYVMRPGTSPTPNTTYFPRYTGTSNSIVVALAAVGADSSYAYRTKIAAANGISGYTGTAAQNTKMLNLLKAGTLKKP